MMSRTHSDICPQQISARSVELFLRYIPIRTALVEMLIFGTFRKTLIKNRRLNIFKTDLRQNS
jgi:hypothetical protein